MIDDIPVTTPCDACALPKAYCICALTPRIAATTRLVLLIQQRETRKSTNTGMLAARCLVNSEVHVVGAREHPVDYANLARGDATNLLLFPDPGARILTPELGAALPQPVRLIVPDGNWRQAQRMRRKLAVDGRLLPVVLPRGEPRPYALRRRAEANPEGLATCLAVARALAVLEGTHIGAALAEAFELFVERYRASRGMSGS